MSTKKGEEFVTSFTVPAFIYEIAFMLSTRIAPLIFTFLSFTLVC